MHWKLKAEKEKNFKYTLKNHYLLKNLVKKISLNSRIFEFIHKIWKFKGHTRFETRLKLDIKFLKIMAFH